MKKVFENQFNYFIGVFVVLLVSYCITLKTNGNLTRKRAATLTIFSVSKHSEHQDSELAALGSWLALKPRPIVALIGKSRSFQALEDAFPGKLFGEIAVDFSFHGLPLLHSILKATTLSKTDIVALVDSETKLNQNIYSAADRLWASQKEFLLFQWKGSEKVENGNFQVLMWNNPRKHLTGWSPAFLFGRGSYPFWILKEVLFNGTRTVINATEYFIDSGPKFEFLNKSLSLPYENGPDVNSGPLPQKWEMELNKHLACIYGKSRNESTGEVFKRTKTLGVCNSTQGILLPYFVACQLKHFSQS